MKKLLLIGTMMALLAAACSSPEPEPTPTPDPTATLLPSSTPEPTVTPTPEPTLTASPTTEPHESLPDDTSNLFVAPGYGFRVPAGWIGQAVGREDYYNSADFILFSAPEDFFVPMLQFELIRIDDLGGDPLQALERYSQLRMDFLRKGFAEDLEITNEQEFSAFSAEGVILGREMEWVIPSADLEGLTQLYIEPNGFYGYMFEGIQIVGQDAALGTLAPAQIVSLAGTSFFPVASSLGSAYAPFGNPFTEFGFAFGIPGDAQATVTSLTGGPDQPASAEDGLVTLGYLWANTELRAYLSWSSSDTILAEKALQNFLKANATDFYSTFTIVGVGKLDVALDAVDGETERFEGRYLEGEVPSGQAMLGAWQCPDDRRVYVLHVENDIAATFLDTGYFFVRFLIGFACP